MNKKFPFLLIPILALGFMLRIFNVNWDGGFHLHPDERAIVLFTLPLHFPATLKEFLSIQSPWNPHFFAYGSFPIYLLRIISWIGGYFNPYVAGYDGITILGRVISALFDTGTIALVFLIAKKLFGRNTAIFSAFVYAIAVLPIQLSHFYAVDIMLNFFIFLTILFCLYLYERRTVLSALLTGLSLGLVLATKATGAIVGVSIVFSLCYELVHILIFDRSRQKIVQEIIFLLSRGVTIAIGCIITFAICEPYGLIDFLSFVQQTQAQSEMTKSAFTFPYTLQYVGITPYIYELKNIFFWGYGIVASFFAVCGLLLLLRTVTKQQAIQREYIAITTVFIIVYFAIVGSFAVGWIRYMLPLYPFLAIVSGLFLSHLAQKKSFLNKFLLGLCLFFLAVWPASFMHIYTVPHTRVIASNWINEHIPAGKTLAVEHWDDALPLFGQDNYHLETLELYNPDTPEKWGKVNSQLLLTDDIILSSNRLYVPLQKLTNCAVLPAGYCYPQTARYYQSLFNGSLGFKKVAEFSVQPEVPLLHIPINDQEADESFTVYDHPIVIIFAKTP